PPTPDEPTQHQHQRSASTVFHDHTDIPGTLRGPAHPPEYSMTETDVDLADGDRRDDLSIDQQLALRTAAVRLADEFTDIFGGETIERFLHTSYDQFAVRSSVPHFLPLLAERFARQR